MAVDENAVTSPVSPDDLMRDTLNGLIAFIIPGPDPYSVAQGVSTKELGGIDAGILDLLIENLNMAQPSPPGGPSVAGLVAFLLNQVAASVNASAKGGNFPSPFARLSFGEKIAVFKFIEGDPSMEELRRIAVVLPYFVCFLTYSEATVVSRDARVLTRRPVGWDICNYSGPADGHAEFKGYYQGRRMVETSAQYRS
jgi:hypothetical protein